MKGALDGYLGKEISLEAEAPLGVGPAAVEADDFEITFGYCTEFIINLEKEYDEDT